MDDLQQRKTLVEIQKLELESRTLARPWFRQSASYFAITALLASISANFIQFSTAERNRQLAEIRKERLEFDALKLEAKTEELKARNALLAQVFAKHNLDLEATKQDLDGHRKLLEKLTSDIQSATVSRSQLLAQVTEAKTSAEQISTRVPARRAKEPRLTESYDLAEENRKAILRLNEAWKR